MKNTDAGGFTLIEVMVAMIILTISLGAIFQALSSSRNISLKADETLQAVRLAGNLLADPGLMDIVSKGRDMTGPVGDIPCQHCPWNLIRAANGMFSGLRAWLS